MSNWLTRQSRFVVAAFLVLAVAGGFALTQLPVGLFPTISFPRVSVSIEAGDRPVDQMIVQVTRPTEEALRAIPGVRNIRSQTSRGSADVSVTFNWGRDMATAALQAESELAKLSPSMPAGFAFQVRRMDPTIFPVLGYSITSQTQSQVSLKNLATYVLRPLIASIDGVAEVSVLGGRDAEYQVIADPARLQALGLSLLDVEAALASNNLVAAAGRFEDRSRLLLTLIDDRLQSIDDIGSIVLKTGAGSVVELDDVAEVRMAVAPEWTRVTADGRNAVLLNIRQAPDANSLALTDAVKAVLQREASRLPAGVDIKPYYDQSDLVRAAAGSVRDAILIGTLLAGIVLFVFLRSLRFVLIVAMILPAVLAASALVLSVLGASLNIMTLGGMAAAVGLIVDDIVVMLEHITRKLDHRKEAALEAAAEMVRPLIGSSLATIVVFMPLAFLNGVTGGFFKALAVTMSAALVLSLAFCLTAAPLMAKWWARHRDALKADGANAWLHSLIRGYESLMRVLLRHPRLGAVMLAVVAVLAGGFASTRLASGFMPQMDEGGFVLDYVARPGLSLTETDGLVCQVENIIRSVPEVDSYSRRTGLQLGGGLTEANEGDMFVRLVALPRRPIEAVMSEIRTRIDAEVPGLTVETVQLIGDLIGDLTAVPQPIEVKLYGTDPSALVSASDQVLAALESVNGVVEVRKSDRVAGDAIVVTLDRAHLALENLDPASVSAQLEGLIGGTVSGSVQTGQRSLAIRVWTPESMRDRVSAVEKLLLRSGDGRLLPLARVARIRVVSGQAQISRENLQPMAAVTGRLEGRDMGSAMRDVAKLIAAITLPPSVRFEFGGLYAEQQKSFRDLLMVFSAALVLSGLLFLFLFRDVLRAIAIIFVVGLSIAGVLCGLALTGTELNISAMMGLTMVIGIVGELSVFYFAELGDGAAEVQDRIAAGAARLRPILMSALIAILALSPLALKIGQGSALLAPMSVAIIAGLIVGAPAVLIAAPLLETAMTRRRRSPGGAAQG